MPIPSPNSRIHQLRWSASRAIVLGRAAFTIGAALQVSHAAFASAQPVRAIPSIRVTPDVRIDGAREDIEYEFPGRFLVSRHWQIAVFNALDHHFLVFDSAGKRVGQFGGRGDGPGEFNQRAVRDRENLRGGFIADTMWIYDAEADRVSLFGPSFRLIRTVNAPQLDSRVVRSFMPIAYFSDGRVVATATIADAPDGALIATTSAGNLDRRILTFDPDVGTVRRDDWFVRVPFWGRPLRAVSPDGSRLATVTYSPTAAGRGEFRITVLRINGDTIYSRTHPFAEAPVTTAMANDSLRGIRMRNSAGATAEPDRAMLAEVRRRVPTVQKPFGYGAVMGFDGTLWIARGSHRAPSARPDLYRWLVIGETGAILGEAELPVTETVAAVSRTRVLTVKRDSDGFLQMMSYRVSQSQ